MGTRRSLNLDSMVDTAVKCEISSIVLLFFSNTEELAVGSQKKNKMRTSRNLIPIESLPVQYRFVLVMLFS